VLALAAALPVALAPAVDPARAAGSALWRWSAVGGPAISASYELDPLGEVALALVVSFSAAALATAARAERRHVALPAILLGNGFVALAVVVTSDLVAAIVALSVLASLTVLALLAVAPLAATARAAAYLAFGLQAWILAALLVARSGAPDLLIEGLAQPALGPDVLLAAALGALLIAGLYPAVAWSFAHERAGDESDPGRLGSLALMPVGIAATLLVLRLLAAADVPPAAIGLPDIPAEVRLAMVVLVALAAAVAAGRGPRIVPPLVFAGGIIAAIAALPLLSLAQLVLAAVILTAAYAAVVSLAMPDHWETVRGGLALVLVWVGLATASPLAIAGGALALFARAVAALLDAQGLEPHRQYIALAAGSAAFVTGALATALGAAASADAGAAVLGAAAATLVVAIELAQVARRFRITEVPRDLDAASALVALLVAVLGALLLLPLEAAALERVRAPELLSPAALAGLVAGATAVVVLARTVRPLLPYLEAAAERSGPLMQALDPAPVAAGAFRALEGGATRAGAGFGALERRAGVWLAALLIVAVLFWSVR